MPYTLNPRADTHRAYCHGCEALQPLSKFRHEALSDPQPNCKDCERQRRQIQKDKDPAHATIVGRIKARRRWLSALGIVVTFNRFWDEFEWFKLVPLMHQAMQPGALCPKCALPFANPRDITIDHQNPPRHQGDLEREHLQNLLLVCHSCNVNKANRELTDHVDLYAARGRQRCAGAATASGAPALEEQLSLFLETVPASDRKH